MCYVVVFFRLSEKYLFYGVFLLFWAVYDEYFGCFCIDLAVLCCFYAVFCCFWLFSRLSAVSKSLGAFLGSKVPKTSSFLVFLNCVAALEP